jgi:hypothetical protein
MTSAGCGLYIPKSQTRELTLHNSFPSSKGPANRFIERDVRISSELGSCDDFVDIGFPRRAYAAVLGIRECNL